MHGRGKMAAAPTSDAARRGDARGTLLPARRTMSSFFFFFRFRIRADSCRFGSDGRRLAPNRADSSRTGPNRIVSAEYRCVSAGKRKSAGEKKKKLLKSENTSGFDAPLSPYSLALIPFFFFFFFFASSPSSSFFLASPAFQFLLFL